jgi:tRNA-2-methylthio-N6-dimethylallyladenosine synthase
MASYYFETFGCQMNIADSDSLAELLALRGFSRAGSAAEANLVIVNTCSVRAHAESRAMARIAEYARKKKRAPHKQNLWVIGCMAERLGDSLKQSISGIDRIIGATQMEYLPQVLDSFLDNAGTSSEPENRCVTTSTFLPIMRGCDNYCSYCIVPYVRGREKSIPAETLVGQVRRLTEAGAKEITLLGQNVNSYIDGTTDFAGLLEKIHSIDKLKRIRFTTSHPKDCTHRLISTVAALSKCCQHFHVPVQSGSTRILEAMNRRYSREDYLNLIEKIRTASPMADITTDIMVGFPGETDDDFEQTVSLFEQVKFTTAFMFAYSVRGETAAAKLPGVVAEEIKKQRLSRIIAIQTLITRKTYQNQVGRTVEVLFTQRQNRRDKAWMGQDNGCKRVLLDCNDNLAGMILSVRVVRSSGMTLIAERTEK